MDGLASPAADC